MYAKNIYIDTLTVMKVDKSPKWTGEECPICWDDKFFPPLHKSYKYVCKCPCHKNQE